MKSQWIPCNGYHQFWVLYGMPRSFRRLFFHAKPDLLMVCRKIKPWLVKGDNELPIVVLDGSELAQELNWETDTLRFWVGVRVWGTARRCFTAKPSVCVKCRWTVVVRMQVRWASSRIEENGYCSVAFRITWSIMVPWGVNKNRDELPLTQILSHGRGGDCIRAKYSSKFVGDDPGRKSFEREK
jgi:hypothetical protein